MSAARHQPVSHVRHQSHKIVHTTQAVLCDHFPVNHDVTNQCNVMTRRPPKRPTTILTFPVTERTSELRHSRLVLRDCHGHITHNYDQLTSYFNDSMRVQGHVVGNDEQMCNVNNSCSDVTARPPTTRLQDVYRQRTRRRCMDGLGVVRCYDCA